MRLPFDLLSQNYIKPKLFLCEINKKKICELETISLSGSFKFNAYSELNFTISRTYTNMVTGETLINPFYHKVEALRLVYLEGFGYFEIQEPEIFSDGIKEVKNVTAYSLEYRLSQKYLENFKVNTGEVDSLEVMEAGKNNVEPITLVHQNRDLSLTDLVLEKVYDWQWGHIDPSLVPVSRQFDVSRASIYDFIVQDLCDKFNCYAIFDTIDNKINLYAEAWVTKHIGDGQTDQFIVSSAYDSIGSVTIDSYRTTKYTYDVVEDKYTNKKTGYITFDTPPDKGAMIEITDGSQDKWRTDVYITFDNLAQEVNVSYSAEDIKTVLTVKGADDLDIREVNMGLPYIVDLSYYHTVDWMGQQLYDEYKNYIINNNNAQSQYAENAKQMLEIADRITYENQRLSLKYSIAENVTSTTVGTYYVKCGTGEDCYYKEVKLPDEYNAKIERYYMLSGTDLNEDKFSKLYAALQAYFVSGDQKDVSEIDKLSESFAFMEVHTINGLSTNLSEASTLEEKNNAILDFFKTMWDQLGKNPLISLYLQPYEKIAATNTEAGWDVPSNENYWRYYPVTLVIDSLKNEITAREDAIDSYNNQYGDLQKANDKVSSEMSIYNYFKDPELIKRLSPFLREDEYTDDNFVETDSDTIDMLMETKQGLLECGRVELNKLREPKLSFSMDMANIYALVEFEPIIDQFQLGNFVNVAIRPDYIKKARLLAVDINFDDFSDFSCEFGELTNLKTPSSIHADLLANALSAGNSVASGQSYWDKGADLATATDLKIQNGLLDAISGIYNADKSVLIDNNGILLRQVLDNGEYSPYQIWLTNNNILVSTDGFDTAQTGIGVFEVDGRELYGVLAKAVLAGYIEGSHIVGGTININDKFIVDEEGNVTMNAASIDGYVTSDELSDVEDGLSSRISVTEDGIATKVSKGEIISSINQSAESTTINANKISLAGKNINLTSDNITIASTNFSVDKDGKITATSGEIAGWTIYNSILRKELIIDDVTYQMYMQAPDGVSTSNAFAVRKKNPDVTSWDVQFSVNYAGKMTAKNADVTGKITASSGSIAGYNIGSGGCYSNAIYKRVAGDGSGVDYEVGLKATSGDTDLAFYVKQSADDWASNSNVFYVRNNGQLYAKNADVSGKITASSGKIGGWNIGANDISGENGKYKALISKSAIGTSGDVVFGVYNGSSWTCYMDGAGKLVASNADISGKITATSGSIGGCSISNGTLNVDAANITSGTIAAARIPNLSANKITSGTINASNVSVTNLNASNITSGTIGTGRLDASVITTGNFSSKTLSTANLTMAGGCRLGVASEYNAKLYSTGGYTWMEAFTPNSSYLSSVMNIVRAGVNVASTREIKHEIHDFDDRYDRFFDKLNPQLFKYNFESDMGYSMGFIWEEARLSMDECGLTENDMGAIHESAGTIGGKVFRKDDFVALNTWQIQKLKARIDELEKKLEALERNDTK